LTRKPIKLLLQELSTLINENIEETGLFYDKKEIVGNWLGYDPAIDEVIKKKEAELQMKLPQSYLEFLKISNGFRQVSCFVGKLYPVEKIDWTKNLHDDLLNAFEGNAEFDHEVTDEILKDYSDENRTQWRYADFKNTITISDWGDSALLMLNPHSKNKNEVWEFANWLPGIVRHKNFYDFIESQLEATKDLL